MSFEPQKFFIGLVDFFSILLPGAALTFFLMDPVGPTLLGKHYATLSGANASAAFLFASYLLGHLVFLLGSWLDEFYDRARGYTLNKQIAMLARRGRLLPWAARALIWLVFKGERNFAVDRAAKIKEKSLDALQAKDAINTFQWSKARLNLESQDSLAVVQRFEADSKFFRSLAVVLFIILLASLVHVVKNLNGWQLTSITWKNLLVGFVILFGLLLSLWRYMDQRLKATNQAYWSVITWMAKAGKEIPEAQGATPAAPVRAGGVVFRKRRGRIEYLLVEAKDQPDQWVLPKGKVEGDEDLHCAAIREVREEAGVWAAIGVIHPIPPKVPAEEAEKARILRRVEADLGNSTYTVEGNPVQVRFFLMEALGRARREEAQRKRLWLPLEAAKPRASFDETRTLLDRAEQVIRSAKP